MPLPKIETPKYSLILPSSGKEVKYRPFLVKEEKILLIAMESEDEKQIMDATKNVIKNCVFGEIDVENMPTFDIEYIFLWLRGKSKGEQVELKYKCPKCDESILLSFNIEDIKVNKDLTHTNKIELQEGLGVVLKYPNIGMQVKIDKIENNIEKIFESILLCIDYIYDKETTYPAIDHTYDELKEFVDSLNEEQFKMISDFFENMPSLKHKTQLHCKNKIKGEGGKKDKVCGYKEDIVLEGLQSFFA